MSVIYTHPPHPSQALSPLKLSFSRDPHQLPDFTPHDSPVLYLPPLLSSLPEQNAPIPMDNTNPPLLTETRLPNIDPASLSLHKALHHFSPKDTNYAATAYADAFNWSDLILPPDEEREWYCVVFRSKRKAGSDALYEADKKAHEEAIRNGGLILYWYGIPNQESGMNLATCIWQSRKHAIAANSRPDHIRAMKLATNSYEVYTLERYVLRKAMGHRGVTILSFEGGDVGW